MFSGHYESSTLMQFTDALYTLISLHNFTFIVITLCGKTLRTEEYQKPTTTYFYSEENRKGGGGHYHDVGNFFRVVSIQIKLKRHHFPVVGFQLAFSHPVTNIGNLKHKLKIQT